MQTYAPAKIGIRKTRTPEGFLRLHDVRISRIGEMHYGAGQTPVPVGPDGIARITRDETVVFDPDSLASWVGKPVTIKHPSTAVTADNWAEHASGHVENARRGSPPFTDFMVGDVLVTRPEAIALADQGCEISGGYDAAYVTDGPGRGRQTRIVGNHLAFLPDGIKGRCGPMCYVGDQSMDLEEIPAMTTKPTLTGVGLLQRLFGAKDEAGVQAVLDQAAAEERAAEVATKDAAIAALTANVEALTATVAKLTADAEAMGDEDEDEDDKDKTTMDAATVAALAPRVAAAAEILSPGLKVATTDAADLVATFDALCACQRAALTAAAATPTGKIALDAVAPGQAIADMTVDQLGANFFAAAAIMGAKNNAALAAMTSGAGFGSELQTSMQRSDAASKASADRWAARKAAQSNLH